MSRGLTGRWKVVNENYSIDTSSVEYRLAHVTDSRAIRHSSAQILRPWVLRYFPHPESQPLLVGRYSSHPEAIAEINTIEWWNEVKDH